MGLPRNNRLITNAFELRQNLTYAERKLWYGFLAQYQVPFRQQKIIGSYIVDFFCNKARLSIELDGESHYTESQIKYDLTRTTYLEMLEVKELRFTNIEVRENFEGVCSMIHDEVQKRRNDLITIPLELVRKKQ